MADFERRINDSDLVGADFIPLGLDFEKVLPLGISLEKFQHLLYVSDDEESMHIISSHLINIFKNIVFNASVMLIDSNLNYKEFKDSVATYVCVEEKIKDMGNQLMFELDKRITNKSDKNWFIIIPDLESFLEVCDITREQMVRLYKVGWKYGLFLIVGSTHQYIGSTINNIAKDIRKDLQWVLLGMRLNDQNFLSKVYNSKEVRLEPDEAYLHSRKDSQKIKISWG